MVIVVVGVVVVVVVCLFWFGLVCLVFPYPVLSCLALFVCLFLCCCAHLISGLLCSLSHVFPEVPKRIKRSIETGLFR